MWRRSAWLLAFCLAIGSVAIAQDAFRGGAFQSGNEQATEKGTNWTTARLADRLKSLRNDGVMSGAAPVSNPSSGAVASPEVSILKNSTPPVGVNLPATSDEPVVRASIGDDENRPPARSVRTLADLMGQKESASEASAAQTKTTPSVTMDTIQQQAVTPAPSAAQSFLREMRRT